MRSLQILKIGLAALAAGLLSGCLVSEEPVLDAATGKGRPFAQGQYTACDSETAEDCTLFAITRLDDGSYSLTAEDEDPAIFRFRRIARDAYAVQSAEDDGYAYYYGAGDSSGFSLTMMLCQDLPETLRAKLIAKNDLSTQDQDFEVCTVETMKGLVAAAKAYHRGQTTGEENATIFLTPVAGEAGE